LVATQPNTSHPRSVYIYMREKYRYWNMGEVDVWQEKNYNTTFLISSSIPISPITLFITALYFSILLLLQLCYTFSLLILNSTSFSPLITNSSPIAPHSFSVHSTPSSPILLHSLYVISPVHFHLLFHSLISKLLHLLHFHFLLSLCGYLSA